MFRFLYMMLFLVACSSGDDDSSAFPVESLDPETPTPSICLHGKLESSEYLLDRDMLYSLDISALSVHHDAEMELNKGLGSGQRNVQFYLKDQDSKTDVQEICSMSGSFTLTNIENGIASCWCASYSWKMNVSEWIVDDLCLADPEEIELWQRILDHETWCFVAANNGYPEPGGYGVGTLWAADYGSGNFLITYYVQPEEWE